MFNKLKRIALSVGAALLGISSSDQALSPEASTTPAMSMAMPAAPKSFPTPARGVRLQNPVGPKIIVAPRAPSVNQLNIVPAVQKPLLASAKEKPTPTSPKPSVKTFKLSSGPRVRQQTQFAVVKTGVEKIMAFLEKGGQFDLEAKNEYGQNVLEVAALQSRGIYSVVRTALLAQGYTPSILEIQQDPLRRTVAHYIAIRGGIEEFLVCGGRFNDVPADLNGETPLDIIARDGGVTGLIHVVVATMKATSISYTRRDLYRSLARTMGNGNLGLGIEGARALLDVAEHQLRKEGSPLVIDREPPTQSQGFCLSLLNREWRLREQRAREAAAQAGSPVSVLLGQSVARQRIHGPTTKKPLPVHQAPDIEPGRPIVKVVRGRAEEIAEEQRRVSLGKKAAEVTAWDQRHQLTGIGQPKLRAA